METTEISPGTFLSHHSRETCRGDFCPLHKVSDHPFAHLPQAWEQGIMWRVAEDGSKIPDPDDYNVRAGGYLLRNSAKCLDCGTEIESTHRHDFVPCACGNLFVDGGHSYKRRGYGNDNWVDTSQYHNHSLL